MYTKYITQNYPFVYRFVHSIGLWHETVTKPASLRKADILFVVNALSDGDFDNNEDKRIHRSY